MRVPNWVSYDFIQNLGMQIVSGRDFSRDYPSDAGKSCILNETAVRYIGWNNPLGKRVGPGNRYQVVGVVKDYHVCDMYNPIDACILFLEPDSIQGGNYSLAFRINGNNEKTAKEIISNEIEQYFPSDPFEVKDYIDSFSSQSVIRIYHAIKNLILFFTILSLIIAFIGLMGLVSFNIQRRKKEIGIRRILGGTGLNIFGILSKEYIILLFISSVVAWPLSRILLNYMPGTYRPHSTAWPYIFATVTIFIIVLLLAIYETIKSASTNPVDALRYE